MSQMKNLDRCFYCGVADGDSGVQLETCSECGLVSFCGDAHKRLHIKKRRRKKKGEDAESFCNRFIVKRAQDNRGRYLVAAADISPGETVLVEPDGPFVACPNLRTSVAVCLECFAPTEAEPREVDGDVGRCPRCRYPLCPECRDVGLHHDEEECGILSACVASASESNRANFFKSTGRRESSAELISDLSAAVGEAVYASVAPLRLLLASRRQRERFEAELRGLMDHSETKRREDRVGWAKVHAMTAGFLLKACRLSDRFSAREVHTAVGMLATNGVRLECSNARRRGHGRGGLGLYATYSLLNHSCLPNTRTKKSAEGGRHSLQLVAITNIAKGDEITTRYVTPQWDTATRQTILRSHWHFTCGCPRCKDPSECGSMLSALKCRRTKGCPGFLLPDDASEPRGSQWTCNHCGLSVGAREAETIANVADGRIRSVVRDAKSKDLTALEEDDMYEEIVIRLERDFLHPNNFLLIRLAEFRVTELKKRLRKALTDEEKSGLLSRQVELVAKLGRAMAMVDPPGDLWQALLAKAQADLSKVRAKEIQEN